MQAKLLTLPALLQSALGTDHAEAEEASNRGSFSQEQLAEAGA